MQSDGEQLPASVTLHFSLEDGDLELQLDQVSKDAEAGYGNYTEKIKFGEFMISKKSGGEGLEYVSNNIIQGNTIR